MIKTDLSLSRTIIQSFSQALTQSPPQVLSLNAVQPVSSHIDGDNYEKCGDKKKNKTGQKDRTEHVRETERVHFSHLCRVGLPVFTHSLSVMLHCCSGDSVVVVKGEIKTAVPPLRVLVLGTGGVKILLLASVLMVVVVADLLVKGVGCIVVVAGENRVARGEAVVVTGDLAAGSGVAVASWKEAVVVTCGGGRGDT